TAAADGRAALRASARRSSRAGEAPVRRKHLRPGVQHWRARACSRGGRQRPRLDPGARASPETGRPFPLLPSAQPICVGRESPKGSQAPGCGGGVSPRALHQRLVRRPATGHDVRDRGGLALQLAAAQSTQSASGVHERDVGGGGDHQRHRRRARASPRPVLSELGLRPDQAASRDGEIVMPATPEVIVAIGALLQPLVETMERVSWVQRHLLPPLASRLADELAPGADEIAGPLEAAEGLDWPDDLRFMRDRLVDVSRQTVELVTSFAAAARSPDNPIDLYRALRRFARVQETLYPLAPAFEPVSRWFLEPERRDDDALVARLREGALRDDEVRVGVLHASNERDARGGVSVYLPE